MARRFVSIFLLLIFVGLKPLQAQEEVANAASEVADAVAPLAAPPPVRPSPQCKQLSKAKCQESLLDSCAQEITANTDLVKGWKEYAPSLSSDVPAAIRSNMKVSAELQKVANQNAGKMRASIAAWQKCVTYAGVVKGDIEKLDADLQQMPDNDPKSKQTCEQRKPQLRTLASEQSQLLDGYIAACSGESKAMSGSYAANTTVGKLGAAVSANKGMLGGIGALAGAGMGIAAAMKGGDEEKPEEKKEKEDDDEDEEDAEVPKTDLSQYCSGANLAWNGTECAVSYANDKVADNSVAPNGKEEESDAPKEASVVTANSSTAVTPVEEAKTEVAAAEEPISDLTGTDIKVAEGVGSGTATAGEVKALAGTSSASSESTTFESTSSEGPRRKSGASEAAAVTGQNFIDTDPSRSPRGRKSPVVMADTTAAVQRRVASNGNPVPLKINCNLPDERSKHADYCAAFDKRKTERKNSVLNEVNRFRR